MNSILHTIIIYTLSTCPFCIKSKELLQEKGIVCEAKEISELTPNNNGIACQEIVLDQKFQTKEERVEYLKSKTGKTSVPQIFIDGTHISSSDELIEKNKSGELDKLLGLQSKSKT